MLSRLIESANGMIEIWTMSMRKEAMKAYHSINTFQSPSIPKYGAPYDPHK